MLGETDTFGADYTTDDEASGLASVNLGRSAFSLNVEMDLLSSISGSLRAKISTL